MSKLKDFPYTVDETLPPSNSTNEHGVYETYGEDLEFIVNNYSGSNKLWTVCDSETSDETLIRAGFRLVNRINFIITDEPWKSENEVYRWA